MINHHGLWVLPDIDFGEAFCQFCYVCRDIGVVRLGGLLHAQQWLCDRSPLSIIFCHSGLRLSCAGNRPATQNVSISGSIVRGFSHSLAPNGLTEFGLAIELPVTHRLYAVRPCPAFQLASKHFRWINCADTSLVWFPWWSGVSCSPLIGLTNKLGR